MKNQRCKGAHDLLPEDTHRFRYVEDAFRSSCLKWGYQEVKTPTLEYLHLFTAAGTLTPSMLNKVYSFLDWDGWSGERVVLRPDGTIPVVRLYIENSADKKAKYFYVTNVFAFEETGTVNRENWQCGVELLGDAKPTSDVETLLLALEILHNAGIDDIQIQLSHAGIMKALLKELKLEPEKESTLLNQIRDGDLKDLVNAKAANSDVQRILSLLSDLRGKTSGFLENFKAFSDISSDFESELNNFIEITHLLDILNCSYQIDITSTGGFEYYTGICFQFTSNGKKIGSGGRYDALVPLIGGKKTPACGFALYIDPLMNMVTPKIGQNKELGVLINGIDETPDIIRSCFILGQSLREAGYVAELDFNGNSSEWRWTVKVQQEPLPFIVLDGNQNRVEEAPSIANVIEIIGSSIYLAK
jgi:histidyl-tRNA synthetase